jgi:hypothetical protein
VLGQLVEYFKLQDRTDSGGAGTQTAGLAFGGYDPVFQISNRRI